MNDKQQLKPGYKKIEGKIPPGWTPKRLKEVIKDIGDGGTPPRKKKECFNGNIPWIVVKDIKKEIFDTREHLSEKGLKNSSAKLWPKNTVILSFGATIGEVGIARVLVTTKQGIAGIVPDTEQITPEFLYYLFQFHKNLLIRFAHQTTISEIRPPILKELMFAFPPLPEQQKIAEILSSVDEAVQKIDEVIQKTQELKKGLMQKLLTKGIEHTKFKHAEIGEIPEEWEVVKLKDVLVKIQNGVYKGKQFYGSGYQIVRMTELFKGDILEIGTMQRVNVNDVELTKYSLIEGDLLFARRSLKVEGSGKCVIVPKLTEPVLFESSIIRVTLDKNIAYPKFYLYYLNSPIGRRSITRIIRTVAVSGVTGKDLQKLSVPLPKIKEQQKIASLLSTIDEKIGKEKQRKGQLEKLKRGLMQDLLTGRVRVKVN